MTSQKIYQGKVIQLSLADVALPDGQQREYEVVTHPGGSAIVAVNDQLEVCLLEQYRFIAADWLWELPAGKHDVGDSPDITARRELQEEAGLEASEWCGLGSIYSSPGIFTEVVHLYLARGLKPVSMAHEAGEFIRVHWVPLDEACRWALDGSLIDAKSIIALLRAQQKIQTG